ncbi:DEAD/DEAH box helicase [Nocardioides sp. zg-579]|uniref:Probable DNA 3'-5' helicase RecG n=1 Tax=Nocardioides marmotae TaxID=2663857 RepID=A0A6I3JBC3_9ACTN|nr:ATP-dependent DNA helicase RecG [Nocardioides marmotae]MCR6031764.1 DEAD/DEAH box helicase [Gordonia jinghuaiqii]MTB95403.1 DEAD/DEAH box helicase [Nocardioides marmotae]QKE00846.1 ATP-dependent DNA helicase RecG [Nocardioides marmotae]
MITVDTPVAAVLGDQKTKRAKIEEKLGIRTVGDLLHHFPRRYVETKELTKVDDLRPGEIVTVVGQVVSADVRTYNDRRTGRPAYRLDVVLTTDGPRLRMSFFAKGRHVAEWNQRRLAVGRRGLFVGGVNAFRGEWQLTNPKMVLFGPGPEGGPGGPRDAADPEAELDALGALYPIYPLTGGVESWDLQRAITFARSVVDDVPEVLPAEVREEHGLLPARTALDWVHAPDDRTQVGAALKRYRFEEALVTQLVLARRRRALRAVGAQARTGGDGALLAAFDARLPFELTGGQREVGEEIERDLAEPHPMNRLLQGEVGSGKTLVALRAMLRVVDTGGQAALLAPTEVLAQQHHRSITAMLGDLAAGGMLGGAPEATCVELLTGSMTKAQRTEPLLRIATGEAGIVIGTHALLEENVSFFDLGLVVVDEQHRFGVEQRAALTDKAGTPPHVLVMTATPIPRTVAMTVFGDLETSTLAELPAGRAPIQTNVVPVAEHPGWIGRVWERVREEVAAGHQAYVVCPRIAGDELEQGGEDAPLDEDSAATGDAKTADRAARTGPPLAAVEEVVAELADGPLAGLRVSALHGRMGAEDKERTMRAFAAGEIDVLVSTTVIEVGVDVANATAMVLLDADRFGVSQLHQLRGRVGRGGLPGLCLLVSRAEAGTPARQRLDAVASTSDGFELSRVDLEQRREGDVLGTSQSGFRSSLQNLRVLRDEKTIVAARRTAEALLDRDPDLASAPELAAAVREMELSAGEFIEKS